MKSTSENEQNPYIWFSMGIDHSNPYIHSTTVLCDKDILTTKYGKELIDLCIPSELRIVNGRIGFEKGK